MSPFNPTHVSHKQVEAYPIAAAEFEADGSGKVGVNHPEDGYIVVPVPAGFLRRPGAVSEGDMLVRYAPTAEEPHGYLSHSPRAVFDAGYAPLIPAQHRKSFEGGGRGLTFGQALEQMKDGDAVARDGWNGKGMFLLLVPGSQGLTVDEGRPLAKAGVPVGTRFDYLPHIDMWTAQGAFVPWLASQSDMLAEDWCVVLREMPAADRAHDDLGRVA
jgi:hypothetical protein